MSDKMEDNLASAKASRAQFHDLEKALLLQDATQQAWVKWVARDGDEMKIALPDFAFCAYGTWAYESQTTTVFLAFLVY